GRGSGRLPRSLIYRVKFPPSWTSFQPPLEETLADTIVPLCEFRIEEEGKSIRITIHNFPTDKLEERIPPHAQIARWKQQFDELEPASISIIPQSYSGYTGLFFEGSGIMKGNDETMLCWSLQMGTEHYR